MKILDQGDATRAQWWAGAKGSCPRCGCTVELEAEDNQSVYLVSHTDQVMTLSCPTCYAVSIVVTRKPA